MSVGGATLVARTQSATVTPLHSGGALIAGGYDENGNVLSSAELYQDPGVTGIIHPKYVVVGVTYAPPGPQSYVDYTNSVTVGTNSTLTNSYSTAETLSVTIGSNAGVSGWASGSVTGNSTTSFTQMQSNSNSVTINEQGSLAFKTPGTPNAYSPVSHDYDIIWLWLNPIVVLTVNPSNPDALTWNGYGFDEADQPVLDIWPIYVGYLNGDFGPMDPQDASVLSRAWSTGQTFPKAGETPALNSTDYAQILTYDPFSNPNYGVVLSGTYGQTNTTTDGRFTLSGGPTGQAQSFPYKQAAVGSTPIDETYTNTYTNITALGSTTTNTTQQAFSVDEKFNSGFFFASVTYELKETGTLTWTTQAQNTITTTKVATDSLYIQGPPCVGSPCNPAYTSPAEFDVYQDNLYGTFMFNPETY